MKHIWKRSADIWVRQYGNNVSDVKNLQGAIITLQNLWQLCRLRYSKECLKTARCTDVITIIRGAFCCLCYLVIADIRLVDWPVTLINRELHTPIATWTIPTVITFGAAALLGYIILRYVPLRKQPPLLSVLAMAAMYWGMVLCILFCIQLSKSEIMLAVYPFNLSLIFGKTVRQICVQHERARR